MKATSIQVGNEIDYTAGTAGVSAGDIVILGDDNGKIIGIANLDIPANTLGALAIDGVFKIVKDSTAAFTAGNTVYVNAGGTVTTTTTDTKAGFAIADSSTASTTVLVKINR